MDIVDKRPTKQPPTKITGSPFGEDLQHAIKELRATLHIITTATSDAHQELTHLVDRARRQLKTPPSTSTNHRITLYLRKNPHSPERWILKLTPGFAPNQDFVFVCNQAIEKLLPALRNITGESTYEVTLELVGNTIDLISTSEPT